MGVCPKEILATSQESEERGIGLRESHPSCHPERSRRSVAGVMVVGVQAHEEWCPTVVEAESQELRILPSCKVDEDHR